MTTLPVIVYESFYLGKNHVPAKNTEPYGIFPWKFKDSILMSLWEDMSHIRFVTVTQTIMNKLPLYKKWCLGHNFWSYRMYAQNFIDGIHQGDTLQTRHLALLEWQNLCLSNGAEWVLFLEARFRRGFGTSLEISKVSHFSMLFINKAPHVYFNFEMQKNSWH